MKTCDICIHAYARTQTYFYSKYYIRIIFLYNFYIKNKIIFFYNTISLIFSLYFILKDKIVIFNMFIDNTIKFFNQV